LVTIANLNNYNPQHPITIAEMTAAYEYYSAELGQALAKQEVMGLDAELENVIAKLKMELDTLDRDIKEREGSQQQSGIKG
jgi:hypothetical protein